jgi:hypothetical protein
MVQPYITGLADTQEEVEEVRSREDEEGGVVTQEKMMGGGGGGGKGRLTA